MLVRRGHLNEARDECLKASNREELTEPITIKVPDLVDEFKTDYIYLAIDFRDCKYSQFLDAECRIMTSMFIPLFP